VLDEIAAQLDVVTATEFEGRREVVANLVVVLTRALRSVGRRADGVARKADSWSASLDFTTGEHVEQNLVGLRRTAAAGQAPARDRFERVVVRCETALHLVDGVVAEHHRIDPEVLIDEPVVFRRVRRVRGVEIVDALYRLQALVVTVAAGHTVPRVELHVNLAATLLEAVLRVQVQVDALSRGWEGTVRTAEGECLRVALVLVVGEEMDAIPDDGATERATDLLILV